jgi:glutaredoxin
VTPQVVRILLVVAAVSIALLVAMILRKAQRPVHPAVLVGDVGDRPGVVLFTSTDCGNCKKAIALLESEGIPFREVTHDLEPQRFETWDVVAVPLTVVIDAQGNVVETMSGVPRRKTLVSAVRLAGIRK